MPDQFVLDFVRRKELVHQTQPLFIQYVLVSSHAPWSRLPALVDWDELRNGHIFHRTTTRQFPIEWPHFEHATDAYAQSIIYDFEVLGQYLTRYIDDGSLVIILGDHQPPGVLQEGSARGVPIHVLSRRPDLVEPFRARGYAPGMRPALNAARPGMETFLFSRPPPRAFRDNP